MKEHTEDTSLFTGAATALATPFSDGEIDLAAFERLVEWQLDMGIDALCVAGTTGEAATLSRGERRRLCGAARTLSAGKVPLIIGCGSADTKAACALTADAVACGADALLVITPYCNKGTADGIVEHYRRVADAACGRPVILYNIPSRTGVDLTEAQYAALAEVPNIRAVKEAVKIPVIANGDIFTAEDAVKCKARTGADLLMLGRTTFGDPWVFEQAQAALRGEAVPETPPLCDRVDTALRQFRLAAQDKGEHIACLEARKHFAWYLRGVAHSGYYKEKISAISTMDEIERIADGIKRDLG